MTNKSCSILGCGWLGLSLGGVLVQDGWQVKGSTTRKENIIELEKRGILPSVLKISDEIITGDSIEDFFNTEILIINFPPERRPDIEDYHVAQAIRLIHAVKGSNVRKVLFISSTSVYPDLNREVTEEEISLPEKGSGRALLQVEKLLRSERKFDTTILRFAGLIGGDRLPGRFLAGKKDLKNGNAPVNLIHRDDCIGLIREILKQDVWNETFNGCSDDHPSRRDYYTKAALAACLELPQFADIPGEALSFKIINSEKIKKRLGYVFKYPSPLDVIA